MPSVTARSPEEIVARLLHRDADLLVLDKPAGIAVHAGPGAGRHETVTDWLDDLRFGLPRRPELAHRLDRETSGCLVLGRHRQALARLAEMFKTGEARKTYWAILDGVPDGQEGRIDKPLGRVSADRRDWRMQVDEARGDPAATRWRVLTTGETRAFVELVPETGRTHQLRVHCAAMGWPIAGDRLYGRGGGPLILHARAIELPWRKNRPALRVEAPPPEPLAREIAALDSKPPAIPGPAGP